MKTLHAYVSVILSSLTMQQSIDQLNLLIIQIESVRTDPNTLPTSRSTDHTQIESNTDVTIRTDYTDEKSNEIFANIHRLKANINRTDAQTADNEVKREEEDLEEVQPNQTEAHVVDAGNDDYKQHERDNGDNEENGTGSTTSAYDDFFAELDDIHNKIVAKEEATDFDRKLLRYISVSHPNNKLGSDFHRIAHMKQSIKDTIIGYLRIVADGFIVPDLVIYACLVFYHRDEIFKSHGILLSVDESRHMVTSYAFQWNTVYGDCVLNIKDSTIQEWSFKINIDLPRTSHGDDVIIGLVATDDESDSELKLNGNPFVDDACAYGYGMNGSKYHHSVQRLYGDSFGTDDIIKMRLDSRQTTSMLIFYKNNKSQGVAFEKMGKEYNYVRVGVSLIGSCSVQIVK
eukprot:252456_1